MHNVIYTIGHSSHSREYFIELLRSFHIQTVIDIRSVPYSKFVPHFNKEMIKQYLQSNGLYCIYMAQEFGARQEDPSLYHREGYLDFQKVRAQPFFKEGIERLKKGLTKEHSIALMCTEKDPIDCHRSILIAPALVEEDIDVIHILENGSSENQGQLEDRLVQLYFPLAEQQDLFSLLQEEKPSLVSQALALRNKAIGYRIKRE